MKNLKKNKGEVSFGAEIIIFLVILFVIWILIGNQNSETSDKPFIKETSVIS